jgi:hypothetical protein
MSHWATVHPKSRYGNPSRHRLASCRRYYDLLYEVGLWELSATTRQLNPASPISIRTQLARLTSTAGQSQLDANLSKVSQDTRVQRVSLAHYPFASVPVPNLRSTLSTSQQHLKHEIKLCKLTRDAFLTLGNYYCRIIIIICNIFTNPGANLERVHVHSLSCWVRALEAAYSTPCAAALTSTN